MTIIIGLTGGIATGKSTVSEMFKIKGVPVIDADQIARDVCEIGEPAYEKIVDAFGEEILMSTKHLNRKKLGQIVFNDPKKLKKLNTIVHPAVKRVVREEIRKYKVLKEPYVVVDVPLLFESNFDKLCDLTLVVFTDEETQIQRLVNRDNITTSDAKLRVDAQMNIKDKLSQSDFKIDNSLSILETRKQFDRFMKILSEYKKPVKKRNTPKKPQNGNKNNKS